MADRYGKIVVTRDGEPVATLWLDRAVIRIGRDDNNELVLPDPAVSRAHATIELGPDGPVITDLLSTTGTRLEGEPDFLRRPTPLRPGAVVLIGPYALSYQAGRPAEHSAGSADPPPGRSAVALPAPLPVPGEPLAPPSRYLDHLPVIFQPQENGNGDDFLSRYLLIFESIWEPLEQRQDHIERYFDPRTCPAAFLPWLARWLDFAYDRRLSEGRVRALLADAGNLHRRRGTGPGLADMIERCTGLRPEIVEETDEAVFTVRLPRLAPALRALVEDLIREHKPAHAGYRLEELR